MNKTEAVEALRLLADAIVETVAETPQGAPAGMLYAAMMGFGMSLDTFQTIMSMLVAAGRVRREGQLYFGA